MDRIRICDMKVFGHTGCLPQEKENGQFFIISCEMVIDDIKGKITDDLEDTVDYSKVYKVIEERVSGSYYDLIEHLAFVLAGDVLGGEHAGNARDLQCLGGIKLPDIAMRDGAAEHTAQAQ